MDEGLLQECPPMEAIQAAEDGTAPMGDVVKADIALAGQYEECRMLHNGLVKALRRECAGTACLQKQAAQP